MKKKIFLFLFLTFLLACSFAILVSATGIDYSEKATLADGTVVPVYDNNYNPLIWFVSGVDADGEKIYESVPNNRNEANQQNDTYVTYTIASGNQLQNINIHIYNEVTGEYEVTTEDTTEVVVFNMRGLTGFIWIHSGLKCSDIQYIYFHEQLNDCCKFFQSSTALRLVDLSVCTNLTGGFGGTQNFRNCVNLHTIRFAPGASYALTCSQNHNWRFQNTAITELIIPANITSLGVDNFMGCDDLERIYILGNTSFGQRNFNGCTSLTSIYILSENPQIDVTSFRENFFECVDGSKTYDFTGIGKYFYFVTTNSDYLTQVKDAIGATAIVSYSDFVLAPQNYTEGRYIISGTNICDVYYGEHKIDAPQNSCVGVCSVCDETIVSHDKNAPLSVKVEYQSYLEAGTKSTYCLNSGCTYCVTESSQELFICLGYSAPENGDVGVSIEFRVNHKAIDDYEAITKTSVSYGLFIALEQAIGTDDIFDVKDGVVTAELPDDKFSFMKIKLVGFETATQKDVKFAFGAYMIEEDKIYYLQNEEVNDGQKYGFTSFNKIIEAIS